MKIKWNKSIIEDIPYFDGLHGEIRDLFIDSFEKQKNIEGKKFPEKKKPNKAGSQLFLKDTGDMIDSLTIKINENTNTVIISLQDKSEIYRKYLHWKTEWLNVSDELGKKLLRLMKLNLSKKGWK